MLTETSSKQEKLAEGQALSLQQPRGADSDDQALPRAQPHALPLVLPTCRAHQGARSRSAICRVSQAVYKDVLGAERQ